MNQTGYHVYGKHMIESFLANGPKDSRLMVFSDKGLDDPIQNERIEYFDLSKEMPSQLEFEKRHNSPICHGQFANEYDYRFDAVKFSHKPATIYAASQILTNREVMPDILFWIDGDIVFKQPLDEDFLNEKFPSWVQVGYFPRHKNHTEGGFIAFRFPHENTRKFIQFMWEAYMNDQIFRLPAWTDCHVFDAIVNGAVKDGFFRAVNLGDEISVNTSHPIVNSDWYKYIDHLKGNRKKLGASPAEDRVVEKISENAA